MARVATSDAAAGTGVVVTAGTSEAVTAGRRNAAGAGGGTATSHSQARCRHRRRQTSRQATARPLVQVREGPNPPGHTGVDVYVGTELANLELACSSRDPSHLHECTVPLENGQRYLFTAAYERDGVLGARSAPVSGWPDSCNPELFHSPDAWPGSNCWRPFADDSPWNTPVAAGHEDLAAGLDNSKYSSAQSVQALTSCDPTNVGCVSRYGLHTIAIGSSDSNAPEDFKHAIYYANASDPYVTLRSRDCDTGEPAFSPLDGLQVRIPAEAQAGAGLGSPPHDRRQADSPGAGGHAGPLLRVRALLRK